MPDFLKKTSKILEKEDKKVKKVEKVDFSPEKWKKSGKVEKVEKVEKVDDLTPCEHSTAVGWRHKSKNSQCKMLIMRNMLSDNIGFIFRLSRILKRIEF